LKTSIESPKSAQPLGPSSKSLKFRTTHKVALHFKLSLSAPRAYTAFGRSTEVSRIMRLLISAFILTHSLTLAAADAAPETPPPEAAAETTKEAEAPKETAPPPPPLPALGVRREQQMKVLLQKWYGEQIIALQTPEGAFVGLWQDDTSGKPMGAVLMLHDSSQMPDWPAQLHPLQHYLSQHGWASLAISLPDPDARSLPPRPEPPKLPPPPPATEDGKAQEGEAGKEGAAKEEKKEDGKEKEKEQEKEKEKEEKPETQAVFNDTNGQVGDGSLPPKAPPPKQEVLPSPPAEPLAQARISAALALLKEKQQYNNVLLGVGLGAARGAAFMLQHQGDPAQKAPDGAPLTPPFQALLLINPHMRIAAQADFNLTQALANTKLAVLDISYRAHPASPNEATLRKTTARKNNLPVFEQHLILEPEGSDIGEAQLNRIVRGFLVKHAKGKQIRGVGKADR
ncbi:MAG: hypothetical protein RL497_731, partial [Pseudomonadota bacterium]